MYRSAIVDMRLSNMIPERSIQKVIHLLLLFYIPATVDTWYIGFTTGAPYSPVMRSCFVIQCGQLVRLETLAIAVFLQADCHLIPHLARKFSVNTTTRINLCLATSNSVRTSAPSKLSRTAQHDRKMPQSSANPENPAEEKEKKETMGVPWRREYIQKSETTGSTLADSPKTVDVYYLDGTIKTFLGVASDKISFARFSSAASEQLMITSDPEAIDEKNEVVLDQLDHAAGLLILRWINSNNPHKNKALIFNVPKKFSFAFYRKIHRATSIFRLRRELRGDRLREHLEEYICGLRRPDFDEFKLVEEELGFDAPLLYLMRSQVVSVHLVNGLAGGEYGKILEYCSAKQDTRLLLEMKAIESQIQNGLDGSQGGKPKRLLESAGLKGEIPVVVHKSIEGQTLAAAAAISARTIAHRGKVQFGPKKAGKTMEKSDITPLLTEEITKGRKVSYASALKF